MKKYQGIYSIAAAAILAVTIGCGDDGPVVSEPTDESQGYIDASDGYDSWFSFGSEMQESPTHGGDLVTTYGNQIVEDAINDEVLPFPEDSLIVKEQYGSADDASPSVLSYMAKRSDDEGDWYWLQTNTDGQIINRGGAPVEGDVDGCADCHGSSGADTDYVHLEEYGLN